MPPRPTAKKAAKAKAKGKAGPKATAKAAARIDQVADEAPVKRSADVPAEGQPSKSRRVERRDTDAQVDRVIQTRLAPRYRMEAINGVVNKDGEHIRPYIANHIRTNRGGTKYLTSKFWTEFFRDFDLQSDALADVPELDCESDTVSDATLKAMSTAHNDNPAQRNVEPLERVLENAGKPSYTEFYGLVHCSKEAPTMTRQSSTRLRIAILGMVARFICQKPCLRRVLLVAVVVVLVVGVSVVVVAAIDRGGRNGSW
jgi:hypothetical protein